MCGCKEHSFYHSIRQFTRSDMCYYYPISQQIWGCIWSIVSYRRNKKKINIGAQTKFNSINFFSESRGAAAELGGSGPLSRVTTLFQKVFSMTFPRPKKWKSMTYRHNIFFPNKRYMTYECLRELLVTVAAACSSVVKKIKNRWCIYTCLQIFHNRLSNTTSFVALELLQLLLQVFFDSSHFCTLLLRWSSETIRLVGLFCLFSIFISWGC